MNLITKLPLMFDKKMCVDYAEMNKLIKIDDNVEAIMLFSKDFEGKTISLKEKKEIFLEIKKVTKPKLIYVLNDIISEEELSLINELNPDFVQVSVIEDSKLSSYGFEKYLIKVLKRIHTDVIFCLEDSFVNCHINYKLFVNLMRVNKNLYGVFDNTKDNYFIKKIHNLGKLKFYTSLNSYIESENKDYFSQLVIDYYYVFYEEILEYLCEINFGFINPILTNYLKFIEECLEDYPRGMAIKYLLNKQGFKSCYSKSPYYLLKGKEKEKLDFIF